MRVMQEELYLYGFPQINVDNNGSVLDSETLNLITICLGTMYGVAGANNALKSLSKALAAGVEKKIISTALTKGKLYPTIKAIVKWFNVSLTKKMLGEFAKNSIPIAGAIIGGGLTFATFKPCCDRLKDSLKETRLANPELNDDTDIIDLEINGEEE